MAQAMGMWASALPMSPMTEGFKVVQDRATTFAKQNAEAYGNYLESVSANRAFRSFFRS
jgi:hypothetical protein